MHCHRAISRRDFLVSTASATVGTLLGDWPGVARAASGEDDLAELTVAAASAAIRKGDLSAERYAAVLLARCDRLRHLKAFVALDRDAAMQAARDADRQRAEGKPLGALGVTRTTLSELVNGKRGISPEMAVRLALVFGGSAASWLTQQTHYDLAQIRTGHTKLKRLELA